WVVLIAAAVALWHVAAKSVGTKEKKISFTEFSTAVDNGQVAEVKVNGGDTRSAAEVQGKFKDNQGTFTATIPANYPDIYTAMKNKGVVVTVSESSSLWVSILGSFLPIIVIIGFWLFMMRQMQAGGNKAMSFGKSRARLLSMQQKKITFKDVAGVDEAKEELHEIIEFLREAQKFQKLGGRIPKGVLLVGPPGTGKTLLARAVAGEANVPFFSISGSDFVEMFVGVGASRVRDLFEQGKKNAPCIIFIDEIDAVGRHRGAGL